MHAHIETKPIYRKWIDCRLWFCLHFENKNEKQKANDKSVVFNLNSKLFAVCDGGGDFVLLFRLPMVWFVQII